MQDSAFITNERNFELLLCNKSPMTSRAILTDTDYANPLIIESLEVLRKISCLQAASWGIILGIKIEECTRMFSQKQLKF